MPRSPAARWCGAIFVAVFALYLVSSSREPAWGDARGMWEVASELVGEDHTIAIHHRWPEDIPNGRNGKIYGIAPIGPSLVHVPGVVLAKAAHEVDPGYDLLFKPLATHVGPAAMGALAAVLLFLLLRDLGIRTRVASLCTAIFACSTTTWVYARMPYSEILQLACFLGLFRQTLRVAGDPSRRNALWLGAWAGLLFNAKYVFASTILGAAIVIAWTLRDRRRELVRVVGWAAVTGAPLLGLALLYNYLRWESITRTGYEPYLDIYFGGSLLDGMAGMLISPNKSAFLYSPPLVLAVLGLPAAVRAVPRLGFAMLAMVVPVFLVYCTYRSWSGDYAWGPRFFVWATPVMLVPLAFFLESSRTARWRKLLVGGVVALGIVVQLLGSALYWDHFIRVAIDTKNQWLGQPNRNGSYIAHKNRGHCDSCFEDTYELLWLPAFHPIRGHWWLVKSIARQDTPVSAQADAPWRHYTTLQINLAGSLPRARIDWWGLLWIKDAQARADAAKDPAARAKLQHQADTMFWIGFGLLLALLAALGYGIWAWLRLHRSDRGDEPPAPAVDGVDAAE